jgi:hypothetical protein
MSSPYDSSITELAEEIAEILGDTSQDSIEEIEHWLSTRPKKDFTKSPQSLSMAFERTK